jgi:hypothetical protein
MNYLLLQALQYAIRPREVQNAEFLKKKEAILLKVGPFSSDQRWTKSKRICHSVNFIGHHPSI